MVGLLIQLITIVANLITLLMIVSAVLSFILPPFHSARQTLDRILNPIYAPLRRIIPPLGMIDITPLVAILLIQLIERVLISILSAI